MPIEFHHHRFPNGLQLVAEVVPDAHTAAIGFFVKTGARDEDRPLMGVSHFLEHMMFKGTARRSAEDVNREFDEIGASYNAFTSHENTFYYAHILPEMLPRAVDLLADMLRPSLREEDFLPEKKVVLEEISMYEDQPHWRLFDRLLEQHYQSHSLSFRVLGTADTLNPLTPEQMRSYFHQRYSSDNITVVAAGRLDFPALCAQLQTLTSHWLPTSPIRRYDTPIITPSSLTLADPKLTRHYIALACPAPSAQDNSRYAARIVSEILGDSDGSRLYWALIDPGLADEASFAYDPQDRTGLFFASASCDPDRASHVEQLLLQTIDNFPNTIDPNEIQRAQNKLATSVTLTGETPLGRMSSLGGNWTYLHQYISLDEELQRIMAVSLSDIQQLFQSWSFSQRTLVRLGPAQP